MTLAGLSIKRPVATIMLMVSMIFIGLVAMFSMKSEQLPNINIPVVTISTGWSGAVPEDVETQITKNIEDVLSNIQGIEKIISTSEYGHSAVIVRFAYGTDANQKVTDIQREVSKLANVLPSDANTPIVQKVEAGSGNLTLQFSVSGASREELNSAVKHYLKPRLESLNGIGEVKVFGTPEKQVQIQVNNDKLAAFGLSPMELYQMIGVSSKSIPLGTLQTGSKEIIARFMGETNYLDQIENIILRSNGNTLRVKDVANVVLTTEDPSDVGYLDGEDSIIVVLNKASDGSTIDLNKQAMKVLKEVKPIMPPGTKFEIMQDSSTDIVNSISGITSSAFQALILATIILLLFLKNIRATLLISIALPVSVIFTFAFLSMNGTSLNLISLMGLSLGVGMLTDNSVVVIDNIYRHMTELKSPVKVAADNGTTEVTMSIIASSLTTMVVFIPVLFIPGIAREVFRDLSYSIIFSNLAALIVSLTLMPMMASKFLSNKQNITKEGKILTKAKEKYLVMINWALKHRIKTVLMPIIALIVMIMLGGKFLKVEFMPKQDQGRYSVVAELGKGIDIRKAEGVAHQIEEIVKKNKFTKTYFTLVTSDTVAVNVDIGKKDTRSTSVFDIIDQIRPAVDKIPGIRSNMSENFQMSSPGRTVEFTILGPDLNELKVIGKKVMAKLENYKGAVDITSTANAGNPEARIILDKEKIRSYGINPVEVGQTISYFVLGGNRGNTLTVKTGTEEIDILIRLPKEKRSSVSDLTGINIKIGPNKFVKLSDLARIELAEGSPEINKTDRIYSISVSANDGGVGMRKIQAQMVKAFEETNPPSSVSYKWGGQSENMIKAMTQLGTALAISIFLIYALLASQFENFVFPIIIIGSIPLALVGVILGLLLTGQAVDIMVMIGVIMLAGIVVNNAIVLIDFIKLSRERGAMREEAVIESCRTRFRPILMTTMTTVFGMIPLALGMGEGSEVYRGMAITTMFGLAFSTLLTLVVIPVFYTLVEDMNIAIVRIIRRIFIKITGKFTKNKN